MATLLASYHVTAPVAQVADNEALVLLQIVGFVVPVGAAITPPTVTDTTVNGLKQFPFSQRTL